MSRIDGAIFEIYHMDALSSRNQWVNRIHPLIKLLITFAYLATVASFSRYDVIGLLGMAVYPLVVFELAELSMRDSFRRLRIVFPFILAMGIGNLLFDRGFLYLDGIKINAGLFSMATLFLKGSFCVLASYLLIATTTLDRLCYALRLLHVPGILVTVFSLSYRYITVLLSEADRVTQAYALRAPGQKGIHFKVWGSLTGQLLLRSMDRAREVYESMLLRGYREDYFYRKERVPMRWRDVAYFFAWLAYMAVFRIWPVLWIIGICWGRSLVDWN